MSDKEEGFCLGMGEINIFNFKEINKGLYLGYDYEVGKVLFVGFKKDNEIKKHRELGSLGEGKKIVFGDQKGLI